MSYFEEKVKKPVGVSSPISTDRWIHVGEPVESILAKLVEALR